MSADAARILATASLDDVRAWAGAMPLHDVPDAFQSVVSAMGDSDDVAVRLRAAEALRVMVHRSSEDGQPWVAPEAAVGAVRTVVDASIRSPDVTRMVLGRTAAVLAVVRGVPLDVTRSVLDWLTVLAQTCRTDAALADLVRPGSPLRQAAGR